MLAIIWHSRTGAARAMAEAAYLAAERAASGSVRLIEAQQVQSDDLLGAGGYLFACPENLGTMSGAMKEMAMPSASGRIVSAQKKLVAMAALTAPRSACRRSAAPSGQRPPRSSHSGAIIATPKTERTSMAE